MLTGTERDPWLPMRSGELEIEIGFACKILKKQINARYIKGNKNTVQFIKTQL